MTYRLTPEMLEVLDEGRQRIFGAPTSDWSGRWTMVVSARSGYPSNAGVLLDRDAT